MESLKLSFNAIVPIFIPMMLGYFLKRINLVDKKCFDGMNKLVFKVFLPVLLFYNIYNTETGDVFDIRLVCFVIVSVISVFIIGLFAAKAITRENPRRGVILQAFFRANYAILGVPLVNYICGDGSGGLVSLMVAVIVPLFNILAVISLELFRDGGKIHIKKMLVGIVKNPLIIGCVIGIVFFASGIRLPILLERSVSDISKLATPIALIVLGASFTFTSLGGYVKELVIVTLARLVIVPFPALSAAALLGFRGEALACVLIGFGAPVAVSSFTMAQQMDGDEKLAAQIVVITSASCLISLFLWIFILGYLGLV